MASWEWLVTVGMARGMGTPRLSGRVVRQMSHRLLTVSPSVPRRCAAIAMPSGGLRAEDVRCWMLDVDPFFKQPNEQNVNQVKNGINNYKHLETQNYESIENPRNSGNIRQIDCNWM